MPADPIIAARKHVEKALSSLERLEQSAQRRPSVLKTMQENSSKILPPKEKTAAAVNRSER